MFVVKCVTGKTARQHISLEPEFIRALDLIAPDSRNKWLSDTTADYIAKNGIESTTRIIKSAIVNALIDRATVLPVTQITTDTIQQVNDIAQTVDGYVSDGRCTIRTAKGGYCTRPDYNNSGYCKQHYKNRQ